MPPDSGLRLPAALHGPAGKPPGLRPLSAGGADGEGSSSSGLHDVLDLPQRDRGRGAAGSGPDRPPRAAVSRPSTSRPAPPPRNRSCSSCPAQPRQVPRVPGGRASGRMMAGSCSGCQCGTSSGTGGLGRPATMTRIPAGGAAGSSPAMLLAARPVVTLWSSSSPSTTSTSRPPASRQACAARPSRSSRCSSRAASGRTVGRSCPVRAASCPSIASVNACRVSWAARRAVMKNDTSRTRSRTAGGGRSTKVDSSAVLPAQGPACHHAYAPRSVSRQNAANSASSVSPPCKPRRVRWRDTAVPAQGRPGRPRPPLILTAACGLLQVRQGLEQQQLQLFGGSDPLDNRARIGNPLAELLLAFPIPGIRQVT